MVLIGCKTALYRPFRTQSKWILSTIFVKVVWVCPALASGGAILAFGHLNHGHIR